MRPDIVMVDLTTEDFSDKEGKTPKKRKAGRGKS